VEPNIEIENKAEELEMGIDTMLERALN